MSLQGHIQAIRAENHRTLQQPGVALPAGSFLESEGERERRELADLNRRPTRTETGL